jgi:predicted enzyme related to lactoylglutathione lyase
MGHVRVDDADAAAKRAESAGGSVIAGPMDIPDVGRFAAIRDPQGAALSVFAPNDSEMPPAEGVFVWDELATSDVDGAKRFYGEVVGWTTVDMDMGDMTYTMFRTGDTDRAGCMPMMPGAPAPSWLTYIGTDDVDATAAKAKELGATVHVEPQDIPNVGRFAVVGDPTGATFGLFTGGSQG